MSTNNGVKPPIGDLMIKKIGLIKSCFCVEHHVSRVFLGHGEQRWKQPRGKLRNPPHRQRAINRRVLRVEDVGSRIPPPPAHDDKVSFLNERVTSK